MKKLFILFSSILIIANSFAYGANDIDEKFLQSFSSNFPNAQKVIWQELDNAYVVSFIEDEIRMRIIYLKNGVLTHFLRYYQEENLPLETRMNIKKKYPDKKIYGVIEEITISHLGNHAKTVYHVKLEDANNWFTIRIVKNKKFKLVEILNKDL